jgi:D-alanine-D-alanine ligase
MASAAVVFGGPAPEHDISILTGLQACRALLEAGEGVEALYWAKSGAWFSVPAELEAVAFADGVPPGAAPVHLLAGPGGGFGTEGRRGRRQELAADVVVNCCHGGPGEDGSLQGALDIAGVAYTGPSAAGAALGMDKLAFGGAVRDAGLPSLPRALLTPDGPRPDFDGPYIVKPRFGGSSIGIETVEDVDTARALLRSSTHLADGAVIEPFRPDAADLNVAIRSWPAVELSPIERPLTKDEGRIWGYADKYMGGGGMATAPRELPADIPDDVAARIRDIARAVAGLALVRGIARLDFLRSGDEIYVNEINTIPGSLAWPLWAHAGVALDRLLLDMIEEARQRPARTFSTEGADGTALRAAGSIAAKLA